MEINKIRDYFPHLKEDQIYFNHAGCGPVSTFVHEKIETLLKNKCSKNIDDYPSLLKNVDEAKQILGRMISCSSERIAFVDNTTNGLNHLVQSIKWKAGDRVLLNDVEFPANVYPFMNLKRYGVEIDFVRSIDGIVTADQIIEEIKPETKLISVSFVQFLSGYKIDVEKLGAYCRENNIIFCVDGIQGVGAAKIDVTKSKIDFLSCGTQKWLLGLQGMAFIYINEDLQKKLSPGNIGWLSVVNAWNLLDYKMNLKTSANVFQGGTLNEFGIYAFNASLKLFEEAGFENVYSNVFENTKFFVNKLVRNNIFTLLSECCEENFAGIVTVKVNDPQKVWEDLTNKKVICALREGYIRFSPHFYNNFQEIEFVVDALIKN